MDSRTAQHAEIARRYKRKRRKPVSVAALRIRDLNRLFTARYGELLPNDDSGRDDVTIMAHHLASTATGNPERRITEWVALRAPWIPVGELAAVIQDATLRQRRWRADRLAWRLRLTDQDRTTLRITTIGAIDVGKGSRLARRRKMRRIAQEKRRRAAGTLTRAQYEASIARAQPWTMLGMSRRTWYRKGKPNA